MSRWYVYQVCVTGYVLYVGKGSGNRYLRSARARGGIAGIIEYCQSERLAYKREKELIAERTPPLNRNGGGGGLSKKRQVNQDSVTKRWAEQLRIDAYKMADESATYLNVLAAASYARIDLNSRGIKGWPAEDRDQALADPRVGEAIRRLNDWRLYPPPASLRSTISYE